MKKLMVPCLLFVAVAGCKKKQNSVSTGATTRQPIASVPQPPALKPSVASADTPLPEKVSDEQSSVQSSSPRKEPTLREVLLATGLKPPAEAVTDLDHPITSYATLSDGDTYLIAYYWNLSSGTLEEPLRVLSFNRQTEEWKSAHLMLGGDAIGHSECLGSVISVHAVPSVFLLDTHINPSAGCLVILDRKLAFQDALYGWYLGALGDTQIIFQRSEVHFAAVHPAELALYDFTTRHETPLFPRQPFRQIRGEYTAKLRDFYQNNQAWCNKNNDPCDPQSVDSTLQGEIAVNEREHALVFVISYDHIQDFEEPVQKPEGPGKVVYVYRHVNDETKLEYREMLLSDVEKRFGKVPLRSLLEPAALREIFAGT
jgi:hypothetical protein